MLICAKFDKNHQKNATNPCILKKKVVSLWQVSRKYGKFSEKLPKIQDKYKTWQRRTYSNH